jgi:hypothetical protein
MMNYPEQSPPADDNPAWLSWLVMGVVVGLVYLVFHFRPFGGPSSDESPIVAQPLPVVDLKGLLGTEELVTRRDVEGHITVISFWGPWSPQAMDHLMLLSSLGESFHPQKDFRLFAVVCARPGSEARENFKQLKTDTEELFEQLRLTLPIYVDPGRSTRAGLEAMRVRASAPTRLVYPTTILLDRKGFIQGIWEGAPAELETELRGQIRQLLSQGGGA